MTGQGGFPQNLGLYPGGADWHRVGRCGEQGKPSTIDIVDFKSSACMNRSKLSRFSSVSPEWTES